MWRPGMEMFRLAFIPARLRRHKVFKYIPIVDYQDSGQWTVAGVGVFVLDSQWSVDRVTTDYLNIQHVICAIHTLCTPGITQLAQNWHQIEQIQDILRSVFCSFWRTAPK